MNLLITLLIGYPAAYYAGYHHRSCVLWKKCLELIKALKEDIGCDKQWRRGYAQALADLAKPKEKGL